MNYRLAIFLFSCFLLTRLDVIAQDLVSLVRAGNEAIRYEEWDEAIGILSDLVEQPTLPTEQKLSVYTSLGYAHWKNGNPTVGKRITDQAISYAKATELTQTFAHLSAQTNAGGIYRTMGQFEEALDHFGIAKTLTGSLYGLRSIEYADILMLIGDTYRDLAAYNGAMINYDQSGEIIEQEFGTEILDYAHLCQKKGDLYLKLGDLSAGEEWVKKSLQVYELNQHKTQLDYAEALETLGVIFSSEGKYADAERTLLDSYEIKQAIPGLETGEILKILNDLGILYHHMANYDKAEEYFEQIRAKCLATYGKSHSYYAQSSNNLATIAQRKEQYTKAKRLLTDALGVYQDIYGKYHPYYADAISNLASIESKIGNNQAAKQHYQEALAIDQKVYGITHPNYALTLTNLGILLFKEGDIAQAKGHYQKALEIRKSKLGINHPSYARSLENLGLAHFAEGDYTSALDYFGQAIAIQKEQIISLFPVMTEHERELFYETVRTDIERYNATAIHLLDTRPELIENILSNQIETKAILLSASEKAKNVLLNSGDPELVRKYRRWQYQKTKLIRYYQLGHAKLEAYNISIDDLQREIEDLEKDILRESNEFGKIVSTPVGWESIRETLGAQEAVIEMVRIRNFKTDDGEFGFDDQSQYLAIIIKPGAAPLEHVLIENGYNLDNVHLQYYSNSLEYQLDNLDSYKYFWKDIDKQLAGFTNVYLSPDGVYHKINPNILRANKKTYVIDKYFVSLITNCTDLLESNRGGFSLQHSAALFGNPLFNSRSGVKQLSELPGSEQEVSYIAGLVNGQQDWDAQVYTKSDASERMLKSIYKPNILHIATHGYFSNDNQLVNRMIPNQSANPLFNSGIYLSGVEDVYAKYRSGETINPSNDGILTAYEANQLELNNTIVVLSACETGLGEIQNGEGVFGLQRAFMVAGAKNILISMSKIEDVATQQLMSYFYEEYFASKNIAESLKTAQLRIRMEYDNPYIWGSFMVIGRG